jgi:hypothetical protein
MVLLLLLLLYSLTDGVTWSAALFLFVAIVALLWFVSALGTRVCLTNDELSVNRPLRMLIQPGRPTTQTIAYRQLLRVEESGRFLATITLLYYPLGSDGLLDMAQLSSLTLPLMVEQMTLRDRLEAGVPQ